MFKLAVRNAHPRDANISFSEEKNGYIISSCPRDPVRVTTLIHNHFPRFDSDRVIAGMRASSNWPQSKYYGMTDDEIKQGWSKNGEEARTLGTMMHESIEGFLDGSPSEITSTEMDYFHHFWRDFTESHPDYRIYRVEWMIYDEQYGIAGSIDCVLARLTADGKREVIILDWKRSKEIKISNRFEKGLPPLENLDHCNYSHYSVQLNIYREILERNYDVSVKEMHIVVFHPSNRDYMRYPISKIDVQALCQNAQSS